MGRTSTALIILATGLFSASAYGQAAGGVTCYTNNYVIHAFTNGSAVFMPYLDLSLDILIVGGGGGGGGNLGGAGGAGGVVWTNAGITNREVVHIHAGQGGAGGAMNAHGSKGDDSYFTNANHHFTALGGGAGRYSSTYDASMDGGSGAGGDGRNAANAYGNGLQPTSANGGYGHDGGARNASYGGGGGGGAGETGHDGSGIHGGKGGDGISITNIFGLFYGEIISNEAWFAGGGGGCSYTGTAGDGGKGGGGNGGRNGQNSQAGIANTGAGGGAGGASSKGGGGGAGIVLLRYTLPTGYACNPFPADDSSVSERTVQLSWDSGGATNFTVYFYHTTNLQVLSVQTNTTATIELHQHPNDISYYWRVDAQHNGIINTGPVWCFKRSWPATWYVSKNGDGTDGLNWATAYSNIQDGVDDISDGDIVLVGPGTYTGSGSYTVSITNNDVTLQSTEGPYSTIIDSENASRLGVYLNGDQIAVSGFSIVRGGNVNGSAVYLKPAAARTCSVYRCVITENAGSVSAIYVTHNSVERRYTLKLYNCIIVDNHVNSYGAFFVYGLGSVELYNCICEKNTPRQLYNHGGNPSGVFKVQNSIYGNTSGTITSLGGNITSDTTNSLDSIVYYYNEPAGDYRLKRNSPARNTGVIGSDDLFSNAERLSAYDINRLPRIWPVGSTNIDAGPHNMNAEDAVYIFKSTVY